MDIQKNSSSQWSLSQLAVTGVFSLVAILVVVGVVNEILYPPPPSLFGPQHSFLLMVIVAFGAGLLSFLAPCTLPILPAYFAFAVQSNRQQIALNTLFFTLGLATLFSFFGAGASALGSLLRYNQNLLMLGGGALVLVFGVMSLLGQGFSGYQQEEQLRSGGLGSSFLFGMTFAVGWTTCIGPLLGIMMTMAATTGSVLQGTILLFIYALGLGLPLILVSTTIGRLSRQSLVWRILRGKGWAVNVPQVGIALLWAAVAWYILQTVVSFGIDRWDWLGGQPLATWQLVAMLAICLAAGLLWSFNHLREQIPLHLHTTQLISGAMFIALGVLLLDGRLALITAQFATRDGWLIELETMIYTWLTN